MQPNFYKPASTLTGPAYSPWFKMLATLFTVGLVAYGISFSMRFSLEAYGLGVILLMPCAARLWPARSVVFLVLARHSSQ